MSRIQHSSHIMVFKGIIVFSLSFITIDTIHSLVVMTFKGLRKKLQFWSKITIYLIPALQLLQSISFLILGI